MSATEYPTTDVEEIKASLAGLESAVDEINTRLDRQTAGINGIGENLQWLVNNVQGLFQMFANPNFMSQMTNALMGQMNNGGQPAAAEPATVGASGEDTSGIGG